MDTVKKHKRIVEVNFQVDGLISTPEIYVHLADKIEYNPNGPPSARATGQITLEGIESIRAVKDQLVKIVDMFDGLMGVTQQPVWMPPPLHPQHNSQGQLIRDARGNQYIGSPSQPLTRDAHSFNQPAPFYPPTYPGINDTELEEENVQQD